MTWWLGLCNHAKNIKWNDKGLGMVWTTVLTVGGPSPCLSLRRCPPTLRSDGAACIFIVHLFVVADQPSGCMNRLKFACCYGHRYGRFISPSPTQLHRFGDVVKQGGLQRLWQWLKGTKEIRRFQVNLLPSYWNKCEIETLGCLIAIFTFIRRRDINTHLN